MKPSSEVWVRLAVGATATVAVIAIALGWHRNALSQASRATLGRPVAQAVDDPPMIASNSQTTGADEGPLPGFDRAVAWLNSAPVTSQALHGKVVLVDFWTYSCINSLRALPYVKSWAAKYKDAGLVVIGVHTPEFTFEHERSNVAWALGAVKVTYPVPMDNNYGIWQAFNNEYWPADYLVDGTGRVRHHHFGEGDYAATERTIQKLLKENGATNVGDSVVSLSADGIEAPPSESVRSPETYAGYRRAEHFASPEPVARDSRQSYTTPVKPTLNQWGLGGSWIIGGESAVLQTAPGTIVFRFHARDLHLVLGPTKDGKPVRYRVKLNGTAPGNDAGLDSAPDGTGEVREPRLYQLIRQKGQVDDRTVEIEFLDPGVQAFVFTFG